MNTQIGATVKVAYIGLLFLIALPQLYVIPRPVGLRLWLLACLICIFLVGIKVIKGRFLFNRRLIISSGLTLVLIFLTTLFQFLNADGSVVGHIANSDYGIQTTSTFGQFYPSSVPFFNSESLRALGYTVLISGVFLSVRKKEISILQVAKYSFWLVALFQFFVMSLDTFGFSDRFYSLFIATGMRDEEVMTGITSRAGYYRYSGAFSEPSLMGGALWVSLSLAILYLNSYDLRKLSRSIIIPSCIILLTTVSFFTMLVFCTTCFILLFGNNKFLSISLSLLLVFTQIISFVIPSELLTGPFASFTVRQFLITPLGDLGWNQFLFGVGFSKIYNFVIIPNLFLQLGAFGIAGFLFIFHKVLTFKYLLYLGIYLTVVPNLSFVGLYIYLFGSVYFEDRMKCENINKKKY